MYGTHLVSATGAALGGVGGGLVFAGFNSAAYVVFGAAILFAATGLRALLPRRGRRTRSAPRHAEG